MAVGVCPTAARADDLDDFFQARDAFQQLDFATAIAKLTPLIAVGSTFDPRLMTLARTLNAASVYGQHHMDRAREAVRELLRADPDAVVDGVQFDTGFVQFFNTQRGLIAGELGIIRLRQEQAREEQAAARRRRRDLAESLMTTTTRTEHTPRGLMFLPFGVGQFANHQTGLGAFFLATEAVLLAGSMATYLVVDGLRPASGVIVASATSSAPSDLYLTIQRWEILNYVSVGLLGATAVTGIIQALVAYVPDTTVTVPRALPPELRTLEVSMGPRGVALRLAF